MGRFYQNALLYNSSSFYNEALAFHNLLFLYLTVVLIFISLEYLKIKGMFMVLRLSSRIQFMLAILDILEANSKAISSCLFDGRSS